MDPQYLHIYLLSLYRHCGLLMCTSPADLADLNLPKTCQIDFPDPDDLLNFRLIITPDEVSPLCHHTVYLHVHIVLPINVLYWKGRLVSRVHGAIVYTPVHIYMYM